MKHNIFLVEGLIDTWFVEVFEESQFKDKQAKVSPRVHVDYYLRTNGKYHSNSERMATWKSDTSWNKDLSSL